MHMSGQILSANSLQKFISYINNTRSSQSQDFSTGLVPSPEVTYTGRAHLAMCARVRYDFLSLSNCHKPPTTPQYICPGLCDGKCHNCTQNIYRYPCNFKNFPMSNLTHSYNAGCSKIPMMPLAFTS